MNALARALDALALALSNHDHVWTDEERQLYEIASAMACGDCTDADWSVLATHRVH
jgi:hypothetical protein